MDEDNLVLEEETGTWRARTMRYFSGSWDRVIAELPLFELRPFLAAEGEPANPFLKTVVRLPNSPLERPVPVGTVSHTYGLASHREVAKRCLKGIEATGVPANQLRFEAGLSEFGEWMNLRVYFPEEFDCQFNDGYPLGLRLECFNSVDGTSRLVILLGWLRFVCSNGLVIGETMVEVRSVHNARLSLGDIPHIIREGLKAVSKDKDRMKAWENTPVDKSHIIPWVDKEVATTWNAKAASRTLHIVTTHTILESFAHAC